VLKNEALMNFFFSITVYYDIISITTKVKKTFENKTKQRGKKNKKTG